MTGKQLLDTVKEIQLKDLEKQKKEKEGEGKKKAKDIETFLRCKEKCICTNEVCCAKN